MLERKGDRWHIHLEAKLSLDGVDFQASTSNYRSQPGLLGATRILRLQLSQPRAPRHSFQICNIGR